MAEMTPDEMRAEFMGHVHRATHLHIEGAGWVKARFIRLTTSA